MRLFLPIFKMNFPEIVDIALPAEGVFHNLVFVSIRKTYPMQAYKIMHGLWGMGQMIPPWRDQIHHRGGRRRGRSQHQRSPLPPLRQYRSATRQPLHPAKRDSSDVLDHATSEMAGGGKPGIGATKKLPGEGFKRPWPPLIKMDGTVRKKIDALFNK